MYILEINHGSGEIHRYFLLPGEEYTIGRKECRILLPNAEEQPSISRHHATISVSAIPNHDAMNPKARVEIVLRDFSKHGTFVDRERVGKDNSRFIYPEDRIRFGLRVTARVLPVTLPLIISRTMDERSRDTLIDAATHIGAFVMEDHVPAPADFYQKHINCVGFLFVSDDKFVMDAPMMEALGYGYTLVTTTYVTALVREIKANDRLMPSEFSAPVPPIPSSLALRNVHYRRPVQTFYSPLEFLSVGSPVSSTVFQDYTMLIPDEQLASNIAEVIELFGGTTDTFDPQDPQKYRLLSASNPQLLAILSEPTFERISDVVFGPGGKKGDLTPPEGASAELTAGLLLFRCGVCLIPEENIHLALYRDDPMELKDKTGACYLQRAREDVEADTALTTAAPAAEAAEVTSKPPAPPVAETRAQTAADDGEEEETPRDGNRSPLTDAAVSPPTAPHTESSTAPNEPVGRRRSNSSNGSGAMPTQITVPLGVVRRNSSPDASDVLGEADPVGPASTSASPSAKPSLGRTSVGSGNGRTSAHLPPKSGGGQPSATAADETERGESAAQADSLSARSIGGDDDKDVVSPDTTVTSTASTPAPRTSAIPARHQSLSSAVAINRRVAERRRSLSGTPMEPPASVATKGPSNRLPPKNVVSSGSGGASARKTPGLAMDGGATSATSASATADESTGTRRRLPASSAPPIPIARVHPVEPLETPNNAGDDDEARRSGSLSEKRPVVLHAASQVGHSPMRQRVEPVKISTSYSDRRYSLPRGSAGPDDDSTTDVAGRQASHGAAEHADPSAAAPPLAPEAATGSTSSRGAAAARVKRQTVRRESVANRTSVTRRASQTATYHRSDSSRNGPLDSNCSRASNTRAAGAGANGSIPRSGRAARSGVNHPHSLSSPVPVRETGSSTAAATEMGSMPELAPAPSQTSARRRRSGSISGTGLPPPVPHPARVNTDGRAASVMPISNSSLTEGYHADAQLGLQCESFSKSFLQGFTSDTERVSRTVLRQTYMDSTSKQFFEDGVTRLSDFLEYMHQHEKEIAPMFSTEVTRRSCNDIRQNATYVLRKIKGTFDSVKTKAPASVQHCRDVLNSRQRSPTRHQTRYNSVSGHASDTSYRRPTRQ